MEKQNEKNKMLLDGNNKLNGKQKN